MVRGGVLATAMVALLAACTGPPAGGVAPVLCDETIVAATDLAAPASGQTLYCLDGQSGAILALDPTEPRRRRVAVGPAAVAMPVAIGCIDTTTLVGVCVAGGRWSMRTWRLQPERPAEPDAPLQEIALGESAGDSGDVRLSVSQSREWLVVSGLPAPLRPFAGLSITGARIGGSPDRSFPVPAAGCRTVAVATSPADALVVLERDVTQPSGADVVAMYGPSARLLLRLDSGVAAVRDAAHARGDGSLWVVGGESGSEDRPEGLWRLDAALRGGRQVVRPVCVVRLDSPVAVACLADSAVAVVHGDPGRRRIVRIDLPSEAAP